MHKSWSKGEFAQLKVQLKAAEKGFAVSIPTTPEKYDLIIDDGKELFRTQIKYCSRVYFCKNKNKNRIDLKLSSDVSHRNHYSDEEIDVVLVYVQKLDTVLRYESKHFHKKRLLYIHFSKKSKWYWEKFIW